MSEPAQDKPPYRVPSMAEIAALPWNGKTIVSTFSGCGGSCLGFKMAGYRVAWASEFIPAAQDVYRRNHPDTILDTRDIRDVTGAEIMAATGIGYGDLDVLEGSPPCASFSTAGKREKGWGKVKKYSDTAQRADDLFFEYIRLLGELMPRTFVAENVSGLVKGTAKGYFKLILRAMKERGYRVEAKLLDAQWLGVPQARQRIIFVGVRDDLDRAPAFPKPLPYRYSIRDALPWITGLTHDSQGQEGSHVFDVDAEPMHTVRSAGGGANTRYEVIAIENANGYNSHADMSPDEPMQTVQAQRPVRVAIRAVHDTSGQWSVGDITDRPSPTVTVGVNSVNSNHFQIEEIAQISNSSYREIHRSLDEPSRTICATVPDASLIGIDISRYAIGREWDKLAPGESTYYGGRLWKPDPDKPCPTVTQTGGNLGAASVTHPVERRKFTIAELKRICAFPDDFILTGSYAQQWERLGRAVPPVMMSHVARVLRDEVLA